MLILFEVFQKNEILINVVSGKWCMDSSSRMSNHFELTEYSCIAFVTMFIIIYALILHMGSSPVIVHLSISVKYQLEEVAPKPFSSKHLALPPSNQLHVCTSIPT